MPNSKKRTSEEWKDECLVVYLQASYDNKMTYETFIEYAKNNERLEKLIGFKWKEVEE